MPGRKAVRDVQPNFSGGLNTTADESQLAPNEVRRADNLRYTEYSGATKRLGSQRVSSAALVAATPVRGGHGWTSGSTTQQLAICNGQLFTGTYGVPMTWTARAGAISSTAYPSFADFQDGSAECCYIADGGLLNKWDGTTFTNDIASTPAVSYIFVYNQRLFGLGDSSAPEVIYWSGLNNGDTLGIAASGGGSARIQTFGEQALICGGAIGGWADILHRRGISRFDGWDSSDISIASGARGISADIGTLAPHSLVQKENSACFLSDRGFYELTYDGVRPISAKIDATVKGLDHSLFSRVRSANNRAQRELWFYLPDIGVYVYNYRVLDDNGIGIWSGPFTGAYTSKTVYSMWATVDSSNAPIVLWGGGDGFVRKADTGSMYLDDYLSDGTGGTAFTMVAQCHRMFFRSPTHEKAFRFLWATAELRGSTTATLQWVTANGSGQNTFPTSATTLWGSGTWGAFTWGGLGALTQQVQAGGRGTFMDVTISDGGSSNAVYSRIEAQGFDLGQRGG